MNAMTKLAPRALAHALLAPASIALVGASDDPGKTGGRPLQFLRRSGFAARVYPINPRRDQVQGERAWPSLASLPEVPEHVFVLSPTDTVVETVSECGPFVRRAGVQVAHRQRAAAGAHGDGDGETAVRRPGVGLVGTR